MDSEDAAASYGWTSLHERLTENEAREFKGWVTHTRRLITGTVLPHLAREPDSLDLRGIIAQLEGLATQLLDQLHDEDPRDAAARPKVQELLDLIEEGLSNSRRRSPPEDSSDSTE
jgi:hypothetical protein